jgi:hypothetical protein
MMRSSNATINKSAIAPPDPNRRRRFLVGSKCFGICTVSSLVRISPEIATYYHAAGFKGGAAVE